MRSAVASAASGDTIDMQTLHCTISLAAGDIAVPQDQLTIRGPSERDLTVDANSENRIFYHLGSQSLRLYDFTLAHGFAYTLSSQDSRGGCVYSQAQVLVSGVTLTGCYSNAEGTGVALGGAIDAYDIVAIDSIVTGNVAIANDNAAVGGALAAATIEIASTTLDSNYAVGGGGSLGLGGGAFAYLSARLYRSTLSGNVASSLGGGLFVYGLHAMSYAYIDSSTISGNYTFDAAGGAFLSTAYDAIYNSTVAFNHAPAASPGILFQALNFDVSVLSKSSLFSNNTHGSTESDLDSLESGYTVTFDPVSHANWVGNSDTINALPLDTITSFCPRLGRLRDNGGPTQTHALLSHSGAIDAGDDLGNSYDQRGPPYLRVSGSSADTGAYEVDKADIIHNADFEGCPYIPGPGQR